jgi:hypothetical protein
VRNRRAEGRLTADRLGHSDISRGHVAYSLRDDVDACEFVTDALDGTDHGLDRPAHVGFNDQSELLGAFFLSWLVLLLFLGERCSLCLRLDLCSPLFVDHLYLLEQVRPLGPPLPVPARRLGLLGVFSLENLISRRRQFIPAGDQDGVAWIGGFDCLGCGASIYLTNSASGHTRDERSARLEVATLDEKGSNVPIEGSGCYQK